MIHFYFTVIIDALFLFLDLSFFIRILKLFLKIFAKISKNLHPQKMLTQFFFKYFKPTSKRSRTIRLLEPTKDGPVSPNLTATFFLPWPPSFIQKKYSWIVTIMYLMYFYTSKDTMRAVTFSSKIKLKMTAWHLYHVI